LVSLVDAAVDVAPEDESPGDLLAGSSSDDFAADAAGSQGVPRALADSPDAPSGAADSLADDSRSDVPLAGCYCVPAGGSCLA
jgi:hypothetical protein